MWMPSDLGEVIAERQVTFKRPGRRARSIRIRFGRPVRAPQADARDPWFCPVQITGLGKRRFLPAAGADSLQSLILALRWCEIELRDLGRKAGGHVAWADDSERPVFAHAVLFEMIEHSIKNLVEALRTAVNLLEHPSHGVRQQGAVAHLHRTVETMGFVTLAEKGRSRVVPGNYKLHTTSGVGHALACHPAPARRG